MGYGGVMTIQELERQLLNLNINDRQHLVDLLIKSLIPAIEAPKQTMTLMDAIDEFRCNMELEGLEIDPDEIWGDVRDKQPAPLEPRW